jgi:chromosome segregation ATPase
MIEQYRNKTIELETSSFELQSSLQTKEQIILQLNNEIEKNKNNKHIFTDEINSLKLQIQHYEVQLSILHDDIENGSDVNDSDNKFQFKDRNETETMESLKLKIRMLERELKVSKSSVLSNNNSEVDVSLSNVDSIDDSDNVKHNDGDDNSKHNDEIIMLKNELNDVRYIKKEHEDMLLQSKKYIEELKYEIEQLKEQHHQQVASGGTTISSSTTTTSSTNDNDNKNIIIIKELNQKLSETSNTIKLLQDKLKEKESNINKLEQEKNKLENYTKRSLHTFKEKYMNVLHVLKEEKEDLQLKLKLQIEKTEKNNITWLKEEKLISSAMFELGVSMMDQHLQSQLSGNSSSNHNRSKSNIGENMMFSSPLHQSSSSNFLDLQRDALERSITDSVLNTAMSSPSNNVITNNMSSNSSNNMNVNINTNSNSANYRSPMINPLRVSNNINNNNNSTSSTGSKK